MKSTFVKGLIMTVIAFVATTLSTQLAQHSIHWDYIGITSLGIIATYIGKNAAFPSVSLSGTADLRDLLSALFLAAGASVSSIAASLLLNTGGVINWAELGTTVAATVVGYLAKVFSTGEPVVTK